MPLQEANSKRFQKRSTSYWKSGMCDADLSLLCAFKAHLVHYLFVYIIAGSCNFIIFSLFLHNCDKSWRILIFWFTQHVKLNVMCLQAERKSRQVFVNYFLVVFFLFMPFSFLNQGQRVFYLHNYPLFLYFFFLF